VPQRVTLLAPTGVPHKHRTPRARTPASALFFLLVVVREPVQQIAQPVTGKERSLLPPVIKPVRHGHRAWSAPHLLCTDPGTPAPAVGLSVSVAPETRPLPGSLINASGAGPDGHGSAGYSPDGHGSADAGTAVLAAGPGGYGVRVALGSAGAASRPRCARTTKAGADPRRCRPAPRSGSARWPGCPGCCPTPGPAGRPRLGRAAGGRVRAARPGGERHPAHGGPAHGGVGRSRLPAGRRAPDRAHRRLVRPVRPPPRPPGGRTGEAAAARPAGTRRGRSAARAVRIALARAAGALNPPREETQLSVPPSV
jgi:hypothetical protein